MVDEIKKLLDDHIPQDAFFLFAVTWTAFWCTIAVLWDFQVKMAEECIRDGFIAIVARWPGIINETK